MEEILNNPGIQELGNFFSKDSAALGFVIEWGMRLLAAIAILIAGWTIGRFFSNRIQNLNRIDPTLKSFLGALTRYTVTAVSIITIIGLFGIPMASFLAVMGAAGLAVGLALQGTLSNVASGVMLLILRPFNVGDYIEFGSIGGTVKTLSLFGTELAAPDNVYIYAPNSQIWGQEIKNYSRNLVRRQDILVGISYDDDINKAFDVIMNVLQHETRIIQDGDQAPQVMVNNMGNFTIDLIVRFWSRTPDYWALRWDMTKAVKEALDANDILIPYPTQVEISHKKFQKE